jgi:hypothetical protein
MVMATTEVISARKIRKPGEARPSARSVGVGRVMAVSVR